jgi:hypothetical protein
MKMIADFSLFSLDEPAAHPEIVISHILAKVKCLQYFLCVQLLLVTCRVNNHGTLAAVADQNSEDLFACLLFGILVKPRSFSIHITELTRVFFGISYQCSLKANIRFNKHTSTLDCIICNLIWHPLDLDKIAYNQCGASADPGCAHNEYISAL